MRIGFLSVFIMLFLSGQSQKIINLIPVPFRVAFDVDAAVSVYTNEWQDSACVFMTTEQNAMGYIVDRNQKLLQSFRFQKKKRDKVLSSFFKNGKVMFITASDNDNRNVTEYVYDIQNGSVQSEDIALQSKQDLPLALINRGKSISLITCIKNTSLIRICTLTGFHEMMVDTLSVDTQFNPYLLSPSFYETLLGNERDANFFNFGYVSPAQKDNAETLNKKTKMYYENDSIYITVNGPVEDVVLLSFSLTHPKIIYRKIETQQPSCANPDVTSVRFNTYLLKDRLYTISACNEALRIEDYDIKTGAQLFVKTTKADEIISYANTPIIQNNFDYMSGSASSRTLDDTRQLLKKMMNGNAILTVQENSHDLQLTAGAYKSFKPVRGLMIPGLGFAGSLAQLALLNTSSSNTMSRTSYFAGVLDKTTFVHKQGLSEIPLENKIDDFKQDIKTYYTCEALYRMSGNDIYLYYNINTQSLTMVEF